MIAGVPASVACPLAAALLLALLPRRLGERSRAAGSVALSALTLLLAVLALLASPMTGQGPAIWLHDRLALALPVMLAVPACLVAARVLAGRPAPDAAPDPAGRTRMMAVQLLTAGAIAACRADPLFVMLAGFVPIGLAISLLLPVRRRPGVAAWFGALLLLAGLGAAMLSVGLGLPAGWTRLQAGIGAIDPSLRLFGRLLLLLPMLLLTWLALAFGTGAPDDDVTERSVRLPLPRLLPLLLPLLAIPALACVLRLRGLPEPDPALFRLDVAVSTGGGVLILLLSTLLLPGRSRPADRLAAIAGIQIGAACIGFGIGGTVGIVAGIVLLASLMLAMPLAMPRAGPAAATRISHVAVLALAGLPPFGTFSAGFMLLLRLFADQRLLALLVLAAFAAGAVSLLAPPRAPPVAGSAALPAAPSSQLSLLPGLLVLALLAWLGLAMPTGLSDWLLELAEALAGSGWPGQPAP